MNLGHGIEKSEPDHLRRQPKDEEFDSGIKSGWWRLASDDAAEYLSAYMSHHGRSGLGEVLAVLTDGALPVERRGKIFLSLFSEHPKDELIVDAAETWLDYRLDSKQTTSDDAGFAQVLFESQAAFSTDLVQQLLENGHPKCALVAIRTAVKESLFDPTEVLLRCISRTSDSLLVTRQAANLMAEPETIGSAPFLAIIREGSAGARRAVAMGLSEGIRFEDGTKVIRDVVNEFELLGDQNCLIIVFEVLAERALCESVEASALIQLTDCLNTILVNPGVPALARERLRIAGSKLGDHGFGQQ